MSEEFKRSYALSFIPGEISIQTDGYGDGNGDGYIAVDEDELEFEPRESRSGNIAVLKIKKSEWLSIRDFLNERFPKDNQP